MSIQTQNNSTKNNMIIHTRHYSFTINHSPFFCHSSIQFLIHNIYNIFILICLLFCLHVRIWSVFLRLLVLLTLVRLSVIGFRSPWIFFCVRVLLCALFLPPLLLYLWEVMTESLYIGENTPRVWLFAHQYHIRHFQKGAAVSKRSADERSRV